MSFPDVPLPAILVPLLIGLVVGALLVRFSRRGADPRLGEAQHRIRALEAEVRVSQRTSAQCSQETDSRAAELAQLREEITTLRERYAARDERVRTLKLQLQHECGKTAQLRQELADRAEEMVRTHVQLKEAEMELGVTRVGSDVVMDQLAKLEQERDELSGLVDVLRGQISAQEPAG